MYFCRKQETVLSCMAEGSHVTAFLPNWSSHSVTWQIPGIQTKEIQNVCHSTCARRSCQTQRDPSPTSPSGLNPEIVLGIL